MNLAIRVCVTSVWSGMNAFSSMIHENDVVVGPDSFSITPVIAAP
jgi:hypothetical protein